MLTQVSAAHILHRTALFLLPRLLWVLFLTFYLNCFLRCISSTSRLFLTQTVDSSQLTILFTVDESWFVFIPQKSCQGRWRRRGAANFPTLQAFTTGRQASGCWRHTLSWGWGTAVLSAQGWKVSAVIWREQRGETREGVLVSFRALPNMPACVCSFLHSTNIYGPMVSQCPF